MKKSILLFLMLASLVATGQRKPKKEKAKDTIKPEVVTVITSYTPTIADAFKIKKTPKIVLSEKTKKQKLSYKIFSAPVASTFVPKSGVVKGIDVGKKERLFDNYIAAGFGNYTTPFVEAFLHQNSKFEEEYGIYAKYISSENSVEMTPLDSGYRNITLGAYYRQEARYFTWKIAGNFQQNTYNWYGLPNSTFDEQTIASISETQRYGFYELKGELLFEEAHIDQIKASLSMFDDKFGSQEIRFAISPNFELPLNGINRNWEDLKLNTNIEYLGGEFEQTYTTDYNIMYRFLNIGLNPTYRFEWKDFNIKLGTKVYLSLNMENSLTDFLAYPDVEISHPLVSKLVNIYLGAGGDLHLNSFQSLSNTNPFISPSSFITTTNEQYHFFGGFNGKFSSNVSFDLRASYKSEEDKALFVRNSSLSNGVFDPFSTPLLGFRYGNSFSIFYDDIKTLSVLGEIEVDITKRLVIGANAQFNSFNTKQNEVWNLPQIEAGIFGKYKNDQWYASTNIFFVGERKDIDYTGSFPLVNSSVRTLESYADVNLNGGYHFNDFVSVFMRLNNILNNDYERFANFNVQGFQVLGGVTYKFDF